MNENEVKQQTLIWINEHSPECIQYNSKNVKTGKRKYMKKQGNNKTQDNRYLKLCICHTPSLCNF